MTKSTEFRKDNIDKEYGVPQGQGARSTARCRTKSTEYRKVQDKEYRKVQDKEYRKDKE